MNREVGLALLSVVVLAGAAAAVMIVTPGGSEAATSAGVDPCCFTNPRYSGVCEVTPGEDETCSSILGYLNNPNSVGKSYCGGTTVRGGWSQVACE